MSRFEGDFSAVGDAPLSASELFDLLAREGGQPRHDLRQAIACYLSASEGWDEAVKVVRGAFANEAAAAVRSGKSEE